jgi:hypothetical protein
MPSSYLVSSSWLDQSQLDPVCRRQIWEKTHIGGDPTRNWKGEKQYEKKAKEKGGWN